MHVVTVLPIARGPYERLSYYTHTPVTTGCVVFVPIRAKRVPAVVLSCIPVRQAKSDLKISKYILRSAGELKGRPFFTEAFLDTVSRIVRFYVGTDGEAIASLVPVKVLARSEEILAALANFSGARLILAPTKNIAMSVAKKLGENVRVLADELSFKRLTDKPAGTESGNTIIITTRHLGLPYASLSRISIIDAEDSAYISRRRPYLNAAHTARILAQMLDIPCDNIDSTEDGTRPVIIGMKGSRDPILSDEARSLLESAAELERSVVFTLRRGLATHIVCNDCGTVVACEHCGSPAVLSTSKNVGRQFRCPTCRKTSPALDTCKKCGGWRLADLGIGAERVEVALRELFPKRTIVRIDADATPNITDKRTALARFLADEDGILVATETGVRLLANPAPIVIVASLDTFIYLPEYRAPADLMRITRVLGVKAAKRFLIQTRKPEHRVFQFAASNDIGGFKTWDDANRRRFSYPPHSVLIKCSGPADEIEKVSAALSAYDPLVYEPVSRQGDTMIALVKCDPAIWNAETGVFDTALAEILSRLPRTIRTEVNPARIS